MFYTTAQLLLAIFENFNFKGRSASEFTDERSSRGISVAGNKVTETGQGIDPSIVTEQRNVHKSYSEAAAINIPQAQYLTPVSKIKHKYIENKR